MFEIRLASSEKDLEQLYRFRYSIYVEEMNRVQYDADHDKKWIRDSLDEKAYNLLAFKKGELIGTARINLTRDGEIPYYTDFYKIYNQPNATSNNSSIVTRLMVANKYRGTTLSVRLHLACYEFGLHRGIKFSFIDCNDHLVNFFKSFGWQHYIGTAVHKEYGEVHPMILNLYDEERFRGLGSPYLSSFLSWRNKQSVKDGGCDVLLAT